MNDAFGEEPGGGETVDGGAEELGAVAVGPEVVSAGALEAVGEGLELVVGLDGEEGGGAGDGLPGALEVGDGGLELGPLAHLVELALAAEAGLEELLRLLRLHPLPLPLRDAAREGSGASAHPDRPLLRMVIEG